MKNKTAAGYEPSYRVNQKQVFKYYYFMLLITCFYNLSQLCDNLLAHNCINDMNNEVTQRLAEVA